MANINRIDDPNKDNPLHRKAEHIAKIPEQPHSDAAKFAAANNADPRIDVRIFKSSTGAVVPVGYYYAQVTFYSHAKPNFAVQAPIHMVRKSERDLVFEMGVLCGAMAERLGETYGDNFDPDRAAHHGAGQLADVLRAWGK